MKKVKRKSRYGFIQQASLDAGFLHREFPDNVVEVISFKDGKAQLNLNKSWELLQDEV